MRLVKSFGIAIILFGLVSPVFAHEASPLFSRTTLLPLFSGFVGAVALVSGTYFDRRNEVSIFMAGLLLATFATGFIHLVAGAHEWDTLLILNGLGFVVLGAAINFPLQLFSDQRRLILIVLACYTLITIVGYFMTHPQFDWLGVATKAVEIGLLICLGAVFMRERAQ